MPSTEEVAELIKKDPTAVDAYMPLVLEAIRDDKDIAGKYGDLKDAVADQVLKEVKTKNNKYEKHMLKLCETCLEKRATKYYHLANDMFKEKQIINWKQHIALAEKLIKTFEVPVALVRNKNDDWWGEERAASDTEMGGALNDCIEAMMEGFDRDKILKKVSKCMVEVLVKLSKMPNELQIVAGHAFSSSSWHPLSWDGTEKMLPELYTNLYEWMTSGNVDLESQSDDKSRFIDGILSSSLEGAGSPSKYAKEIYKIYQYVLTQDLDGQPYSGYGLLALTINSGFVTKNCGNQRLIRDFVPGVVKMLKCDNEQLMMTASACITSFYQQVDLLAPCADDVMEAFLDGKSDLLGLCLKPLYGVSPEKILSRFDQLAEAMEDMNQTNKTYIYMLWDDVAKDNAKLLVPHLDLMMDDVTNAQICHQVVLILGTMSVKFPGKFVDKIDKLMRVAKQTPYTIHAVSKIVASVGQINEKQAERCMKILVDKLKTIEDTWLSVIMMDMKRIGRKHVEVLKKYRADIEPFMKSQAMGVPDMVQSLIDFMEGRSLEALADDVEDVKEDVQNLDDRVTETEENVDRLDKTVTEQGQEIDNVKNEVTEQGQRLGDLEELVDDTIVRVDEIDRKTITNAPKWSRDIANLLNPEHEHDWRFLAIRLGFTGEDVRNWALSPDPTMAILAEWYTIHKSSEATFAILTALQDMGRDDAAIIVEEALQAADKVVPKAAPDISEKPPRVFISYQWDHQPEVKVIKEHLEKAGFNCWLDIGQMGGGDSLFAKINEGMRAAKVVLCMCTEKYSKSENCNKEVNLANLLNKPIIPVLIEKIDWPPSGSMSMLFAQLLYIQFFTDKEYVRGEKFWEDAKFAELLGQISYHVAPDEEMITDEYRNWVPQIDDLPKVVKKANEKKSTDDNTKSEKATDQAQEIIPQVFISYQWDKQTEIKTLYSRLTSLGFSCWLDIMQMGGGDPLYSKIDKGIRNAKVVVSIVTPKYALSANCRREVSLTDALRKPIIPLLMQRMTWPPEGPMSMPFAQLLYIDCTGESTQKEFRDAKFDELVQKLKEHATVEDAVFQSASPSDTEKPEIEEAKQVEEKSPSPPAAENTKTPEAEEKEEPAQQNEPPKEDAIEDQKLQPISTEDPAKFAGSTVHQQTQPPKEDTEEDQKLEPMSTEDPAKFAGSTVPEARPQSEMGPKHVEVIQPERSASAPKERARPDSPKKKKKSSVCAIL
ncbi:uncharacterized protein LOC119740824 [Patiria miniata]|uniref:Death domain-containing protein n=1 Tax=Patiria miniata TaxID=46514 RepID=A0A914B8N5_PATMI|nr:uncharacterized protein LOC119740824 [Patiria miniata]XP_038072190.1 uncharacterized protein LOC119740824 [Patiria miniata]XP_038072191.1 uncharacterized protein LOC119740824 [Patiria miniata]